MKDIEKHVAHEGEKKIEIEQAKPEDVKGISQVLFRAWMKTYPNEEHRITPKDIEKRFEKRLSEEGQKNEEAKIESGEIDGTRFVAREGDKVIGVCHVKEDDECNYINAIYIDPAHQGCGIGSKLLKQAEVTLNPHKKTIVRVASYNEDAIRFYERHGFVCSEETVTDGNHTMHSGAVIPEIEMIRPPVTETSQ